MVAAGSGIKDVQAPAVGSELRETARIAAAEARWADAAAALQQLVDGAEATDVDFDALGVALASLRQFERALPAMRQAVAMRPDSAEFLANLGLCLRSDGRAAEALAPLSAAVRLNPASKAAHVNLAVSLLDLNLLEEADLNYVKALALEPDDADAASGRGMGLLKAGRAAEGWRLFERRVRKLAPSFNQTPAPQRLAHLDQLAPGSHLFLHFEQGLGDTLQFVRYAQVLRRHAPGVRVSISVQPPLVALLARCFPTLTVYGPTACPTDIDLYCSIMSLPALLAQSAALTVDGASYLSADPVRTAAWAAALGPRKAPRVGVAWSGNPEHRNDRQRSLPFATLSPLLRPDLEWRHVQNQTREEDAEALAGRPDLHRHEAALKDFEDTAALIAQMDLVISVDTSVAHLAAAMGKPVWLLTPFCADWRWAVTGSATSWYDAITLVRQLQPHDWSRPLAMIETMLAERFGPAPAPRP